MRRYLLPALVSGALLLSVLLASAPARLLPWLLPRELVLLEGVAGSVWRGSASRALLSTEAGFMSLGRLQWRVKPLSLLLLSPVVEFESVWGAQRFDGRLRRSPGGTLYFSDTDGQLSAAVLGEFLPVRLEGGLSFQARELELHDGKPRRVSGRLVWQSAAWQSPQGMQALGSYAVELSTLEDGTIVGEVLTLSGELAAEGSVRWREGSYGTDVLLRGRALDDPQLGQALQLMAAPEGDGFRLRLNGSVPGSGSS